MHTDETKVSFSAVTLLVMQPEKMWPSDTFYQILEQVQNHQGQKPKTEFEIANQSLYEKELLKRRQ